MRAASFTLQATSNEPLAFIPFNAATLNLAPNKLAACGLERAACNVQPKLAKPAFFY